MPPSPGAGKQGNSVSCAARAAGHRRTFAIVDIVQNCLAFPVVPSDPCHDPAPRGTKDKKGQITMTSFTIDTHNNIPAHATPEEAAAATTTPFDSFSSQPEFAELAKS